MKQAIQEGFILDVLQDYLTIKEAFKIIKVTDENPELIEGPAQKALVRYYKEHGYTIGHKTDVIMSNFLQSGIKKINGHAKAMIVADSRHNAVRYYLAIKDYIKNHSAECRNVGVLVAFSGSVKFDDDPDNEYTEANLNIDADGHSINTDKKFRKAIRSDKYQIMVVADKYQTGFDEPLLHSMYVDKKLGGVSAVQTLSRLNRTTRGKEDTFVLDFVNTEGEIRKAFSQFYEDTILDGITDYNQVYDLKTKINEYMLYDFGVVDEFYKIMSNQSGKKQTDATSGKLSSILKSVVDGYPEMFINSLFPEKFMEIVAKCFLENNDTFKKLYEDSEFKEKVMQTMGKELYCELRKQKDDEKN